MDRRVQLHPLRPDLQGIYNIKYGDHSWSLSLISLQGCYLRVSKSVIERQSHEGSRHQDSKYFPDKFLQVAMDGNLDRDSLCYLR
jgi:hypothetical protein